MTRIPERNEVPIEKIRNLHMRKERERTHLFWTEGLRFVAQAAQRQHRIETVVTAPKRLTHPFAQKLAAHLKRAGTPCLEVTPEVFLSVSRAEEPQWIGAVVRQRWEPLASIRPAEELCWVAHDLVQSPGNLGTIIRTSEAVGAAGVIFLGHETDPYDPACVRATMGALFSQRFVRTTWARFAAWKERHGCRLVGTSPSAPTDYRAVVYRPPVVLYMGNERKGLSSQQQALCDVMVRIPMVGRGDSLNVAVATGVMLYEVLRQRRGVG